MNSSSWRLLLSITALLFLQTGFAQPLVIAHRGASGYLPEHTLAAKVMAHAQGADYLEQDVVLSRDGVPVVLHDIYLEAVSDIAEQFPDRARDDGRWYVIDFTLAELRRLNLNERIRPDIGEPTWPNRFPADLGRFGIVTLAEEIELIQGLNRSTGRKVGLYVELKDPAWHRDHGQDLASTVLAVLREYGYDAPDAKIHLQCFDWAETRRLREELDWRGRLIQLIGENRWAMNDTDYDYLKTSAGLAEIATVADGIGPWIGQLITTVDEQPEPTGLVAAAREQGLAVHAYTLRADALPAFAADYDTLLARVFDDLGVDGAFTDFPDLTLDFLHRRGLR